MTARWHAILDGDLAGRARQALDELAIALPAHASPADISLGTGLVGPALFHAYLGAARADPRQRERADTLLEHGLGVLPEAVLPPGLYDGFTGLAWAIAHLTEATEAPEATDDLHEDIDGCLLALTARTPWPGSYDLIRGLTGIGVYGLERADRPTGRALLAQIVARLDELATATPDGITWFTPPEQMGPWKQQRYPGGCHDLGMAHGIPAVLALLAGCVARDIARAPALRLLDGGVAWLLARRQASGTFGEVHTPGAPCGPTRLAWCYGDLGVASALFQAGRAADRPRWQADAIALACAAAARPTERAGVVDAGLCHGAAGLAHLFNRLFQATELPALGDAARHWLDHALALRSPGAGIAGFRTHYRDPAQLDRVEWQVDPSFLQGAAGTGLALLAAVSPVAPSWDRALLLS